MVKRISFFLLISFVLIFSLLILNNYLELGITENDLHIFIMPLIYFLYFFICIPKLRKYLYNHFIKTKELHLLIALPILFAIIKLILSYSYIFFPLLFNKNTLTIGAQQYLPSEGLTAFGDFLLTGLIGPINEELLFRFFLLFLLPYLFFYYIFLEKNSKKLLNPAFLSFGEKAYNKIFLKKDKPIIISWTVFISILFAFEHGPDIWSFPLYFFGGIVYSYLFLKYGLLSAWIAHGTFNTLSEYVHAIFERLILFIN